MIKVLSLFIVEELPYIKAITISQITSDTLMHCHRFSSARSPHMVKIKLFNSWPPLTLQFSGHHSMPTCKTMGPSYAIQVYGATYGQLFLLSRGFFVQKFKKKKKFTLTKPIYLLDLIVTLFLRPFLTLERWRGHHFN